MNDGKCALFIRISVSGRMVSMSQMSWNLLPSRAQSVKRGLHCCVDCKPKARTIWWSALFYWGSAGCTSPFVFFYLLSSTLDTRANTRTEALGFITRSWNAWRHSILAIAHKYFITIATSSLLSSSTLEIFWISKRFFYKKLNGACLKSSGLMFLDIIILC